MASCSQNLGALGVASLALCMWSTLLPSSRALQFYTFHRGTNASITFLKSTPRPCEMFRLAEQSPFYADFKIHASALQPNQRGRFSVKEDRHNRTVTLCIQDIQETDTGVYILRIPETKGSNILDAYANVIVPLGKAECSPRESGFSAQWWKVYCEAALGTGGTGDIVCFQESEVAPVLTNVTFSETHIRAEFWMNTQLPMTCCSFEGAEIEPEQCTDFQHQPTSTHSVAMTSTTDQTAHSATQENNPASIGQIPPIGKTSRDDDMYIDLIKKSALNCEISTIFFASIVFGVILVVYLKSIHYK